MKIHGFQLILQCLFVIQCNWNVATEKRGIQNNHVMLQKYVHNSQPSIKMEPCLKHTMPFLILKIFHFKNHQLSVALSYLR